MRRTKAFSYDSSAEHVFKRLAREAHAQRPPASESAMLMHILGDYFYRIDEIRKINAAAFEGLRKKIIPVESASGKRRGPTKKKR